MALCGGIGEEKPANETVHSILSQVRQHVEGKVGRAFDEFTAVSFKTQVVAGLNYFIKVRTGPDHKDHLVVRVYKDLQGNLEFHSHKESTKDAEISYF